MASEPQPEPRRRRRFLWVLVVLVFLGAAGYWLYQRATEHSRVHAAIIAAGGKHESPPRPSVFDLLIDTLSGNRPNGEQVLLDGAEIDDDWLAAQRDLRSLDLRELLVRDTRLSRAAILRLAEEHSLDYLGVPGMPMTDGDAALLARHEHLKTLLLMQSELTDVGLAALKPQRLTGLSVAGTRVTAAALQKELAGGQMQYLMLDGRQFTPELAVQLAQMKSLFMIALFGPEVTDVQVELLESMPNIRYFRLDQTSVSEEAVASLRAARPAPAVIEVAPPAEAFFKWRTNPPAVDSHD